MKAKSLDSVLLRACISAGSTPHYFDRCNGERSQARLMPMTGF